MFTREYLEGLPRKELQVKAKEFAVKANGATEKIIKSLLELENQNVEESNEVVEESGVVEEIVEEDVVVEEEIVIEEVAVVVEEVTVDVVEENVDSDTPLEKGDTAVALVNDAWVSVTIKRVNKKTMRVACESGKEITVEIDNIKRSLPTKEVDLEPEVESEDMEPMEVITSECAAAPEV